MTGAKKGADLKQDPRFDLHGPTFHPEEGKESDSCQEFVAVHVARRSALRHALREWHQRAGAVRQFDQRRDNFWDHSIKVGHEMLTEIADPA